MEVVLLPMYTCGMGSCEAHWNGMWVMDEPLKVVSFRLHGTRKPEAWRGYLLHHVVSRGYKGFENVFIETTTSIFRKEIFKICLYNDDIFSSPAQLDRVEDYACCV